LKSTILISGGSGLLGVNWALWARESFHVVLFTHNQSVEIPGVSSEKTLLESVDVLTQRLELIRPDYVVHAAALTDVEFCERNPDLAYLVNAKLAENMAIACKYLSIPLAHISTDHLFCSKKHYVDEETLVSPMNTYGKTKAQAEKYIMNIFPNALIVRTNFYGWGPRYRNSFSDWILQKLSKGEQLKLFYDVCFTPIYVEELIEVVHRLFEKKSSGVYNIVGNERVSKYQFGLKLAKIFQLDDGQICASSIHSVSGLVRRPSEMSLSNKKVSKELNIKFGDIEDHIYLMKNSKNKKFIDLI